MIKTEKRNNLCFLHVLSKQDSSIYWFFFSFWEGKGGSPVSLLNVVKAIDLKRDQESCILFFECSFPTWRAPSAALENTPRSKHTKMEATWPSQARSKSIITQLLLSLFVTQSSDPH